MFIKNDEEYKALATRVEIYSDLSKYLLDSYSTKLNLKLSEILDLEREKVTQAGGATLLESYLKLIDEIVDFVISAFEIKHDIASYKLQSSLLVFLTHSNCVTDSIKANIKFYDIKANVKFYEKLK